MCERHGICVDGVKKPALWTAYITKFPQPRGRKKAKTSTAAPASTPSNVLRSRIPSWMCDPNYAKTTKNYVDDDTEDTEQAAAPLVWNGLHSRLIRLDADSDTEDDEPGRMDLD